MADQLAGFDPAAAYSGEGADFGFGAGATAALRAAGNPAAAAEPAGAGQDLSRAFAAIDRQSQDVLAREQKELAPATAAAQRAIDQPRPGVPTQQRVPAPPKDNLAKDSEEFMSTAYLLAGIAGAFSRRHVTGALQGFAAVVNGFHTGEKEKVESGLKEWKANADQAIVNNKIVMDEYNAVLNDKRIGMEEQMSKIQLIAAKYKDTLVYQAAAEKNFTLVANLTERMREADQRFASAAERLEFYYQRLDTQQGGILAARQTYATMFPVDATGRRVMPDPKGSGTMVPAPDFGSWYKSEWPKMAGGQQQSQAGQPGGGGADLVNKAKQAVDAGIPRDQVKAAFVEDGGSAADFDKAFPEKSAGYVRQPGDDTPFTMPVETGAF